MMNDFTRMPTTSTQPNNIQAPVLPPQNLAIDSDTLFTQGNVVFILHRGERYSLRRTRNGKLILTK